MKIARTVGKPQRSLLGDKEEGEEEKEEIIIQNLSNERRLCNCPVRTSDNIPRTQQRTGSNILFGLLGQGGQPRYFDTLAINDSVNAPTNLIHSAND
ncbi:hypothetical protein HZH66_010857 [Vespula vulgaris]|uniref:Uncharacterized protein n=1 Tax=Vespula vulgaris TaxID=7454 RepID=A0A834JHD7_VESVU|nr:hypothetical protein HZH66_010857 [Vespula vulgaris]